MASRYLSKEQKKAVVAAIGAAEQGNRGEGRVELEASARGDALARAKALYDELGMMRTEEDTGVLLYVAVKDRTSAVFAGSGLHGTAEPGFWQEVSDAVAAGFRDGEPGDGLVAALGTVGDLLRELVPGEDRAGNELPDEVGQS